MLTDIARKRCESAHADWAKSFCRRSGPDLNVHVPEIVTDGNAVLYTTKKKRLSGIRLNPKRVRSRAGGGICEDVLWSQTGLRTFAETSCFRKFAETSWSQAESRTFRRRPGAEMAPGRLRRRPGGRLASGRLWRRLGGRLAPGRLRRCPGDRLALRRLHNKLQHLNHNELPKCIQNGLPQNRKKVR